MATMNPLPRSKGASGTPGKEEILRNLFGGELLRQQLPQDERQNPAVSVVINLNRCIDPKLHWQCAFLPVRSFDLQRDPFSSGRGTKPFVGTANGRSRRDHAPAGRKSRSGRGGDVNVVVQIPYRRVPRIGIEQEVIWMTVVD